MRTHLSRAKQLALLAALAGTLVQTTSCVSDVVTLTVQQMIFSLMATTGQTVLMNVFNMR